MPSQPLKGVIALVTGAARGIGKGVAVELGAAGATVYITGRPPAKSDQSKFPEAPTLETTRAEINKAGGKAILVYCDHSDDDEVKALFERIDKEQNGRLDILVNNAFAAVTHILSNLGKKFYEIGDSPQESYDIINNVGLRNVYVCSVYASRMMVKQKSGLIVNISSIGGCNYLFNVPYGFGKQSLDRMAADMAIELQDSGVTMLSLWPGGVQTELIQSMVLKGPKSEGTAYFEDGESIYYPGRCIAFLYQQKDLSKWNGKIVTTTEIGEKYGVVDRDGRHHPCKRIHQYTDYLDQTNKVRLELLNQK